MKPEISTLGRPDWWCLADEANEVICERDAATNPEIYDIISRYDEEDDEEYECQADNPAIRKVRNIYLGILRDAGWDGEALQEIEEWIWDEAEAAISLARKGEL